MIVYNPGPIRKHAFLLEKKSQNNIFISGQKINIFLVLNFFKKPFMFFLQIKRLHVTKIKTLHRFGASLVYTKFTHWCTARYNGYQVLRERHSVILYFQKWHSWTLFNCFLHFIFNTKPPMYPHQCFAFYKLFSNEWWYINLKNHILRRKTFFEQHNDFLEM